MPRPKSQRILVGGVFSILHPGHIFFLKKARAMGSHLTVVLAHDSNVRRKSGCVIVPAEDRKKVLEAVRYVDEVLIGDEKDFFKTIRKARPDLIVLGHDQTLNWLSDLGKNGIECKVARVSQSLKGYGTRKVVKRIKDTC